LEFRVYAAKSGAGYPNRLKAERQTAVPGRALCRRNSIFLQTNRDAFANHG
jgi:hypothetical protein